MSIAQPSEHEWSLQPAGLDLYDGLPDIVLFPAHLAALTKDERYLRLARAALQNILVRLNIPSGRRRLATLAR